MGEGKFGLVGSGSGVWFDVEEMGKRGKLEMVGWVFWEWFG